MCLTPRTHSAAFRRSSKKKSTSYEFECVFLFDIVTFSLAGTRTHSFLKPPFFSKKSMYKFLLVAFVAAVAFTMVSGVSAQNAAGCKNFQSLAACASATSQPQPLLCAWDDNQGCIGDPCQAFPDNSTCQKQRTCVWMAWSTGVRCFSASLLCSAIPVKDCTKYSFCTVRENTFCDIVGLQGQNVVSAECDVNFPKWSIALMFVWLIIMIILGIIVALAMGKAKQQKVTGVEKDEDVVVDSVQVRNDDNFNLGEPFTQPSDE